MDSLLAKILVLLFGAHFNNWDSRVVFVIEEFFLSIQLSLQSRCIWVDILPGTFATYLVVFYVEVLSFASLK